MVINKQHDKIQSFIKFKSKNSNKDYPVVGIKSTNITIPNACKEALTFGIENAVEMQTSIRSISINIF